MYFCFPMNKSVLRYIQLIAGLLVAAAILLSQSFTITQLEKDSPKTEKTSDGKATENSPENRVTVSVTSLPSSFAVNFSLEVFCLFEVIFSEENAIDVFDQVQIPFNKFFSTLLSVIISPNAP